MSGNVSVKPTSAELRVGGLARFSTCDWLGELVATVFCQGCAWDCPYCHNPHLRPMQSDAQLPWSSVLTFLESRKGLLNAVVFSGGEPTLQETLPAVIQSVRGLGFRIGLHTAGMAPERFAVVLPLLDWVGFDVKAPFNAYSRITGAKESGNKALISLRLLLESGVAYEVRTTFHPALLSMDEVVDLRDELLSLGATHYAVQRFRAMGVCPNRLPPSEEQSKFNPPSGFGNGFRSFHIR